MGGDSFASRPGRGTWVRTRGDIGADTVTPMTAPASPTHPDEPDQPAEPAERVGRVERRRPRVATGALWFLVVGALLALTTVPTLAWLPFLDATWNNVPLMVALGIPVGPAMSAALFAWRRFTQGKDGEDGGPAGHFWRGYRLNWADALRLWVPSLAVLALLAVNLVTLGGSEDAPPVFAVVGAVVAVAVTVWTAHAVLVASLFSFRTRDVVRIAVYFVVAKPLASLGALAIVAAGIAVAWFVQPWLPVALGSVLTYLLWRNGMPIAAEVERRFVVGAPEVPEVKPWPGLEGIDLDADGDQAADDGAADDRSAEGR